MADELFKMAFTQGIWALLSIFLIFFILKTQEKRDIIQEERELRYQKIINDLILKLEDINEIKDYIIKLKE
ncbi:MULTISPECIES: BhlA/UviB family holin-like peptide [Bacillota]|uniref:BhlA/UviB family holin-like peptide n=2 Tax=Bacillota TaxID=1239 RepID=A0A9X3XUC2_ENTFC|nr:MULTISPECIES: BhlA/UviB family holin-like peptide [Bacillota]MDC4242498.1 BhlA/UviB family holin-like peptide [Clostridium tertium]MDC4246160.1 BhlA/UviB family holin-like peptide [Clostridium perfringens]MDC4249071.1 BhlA/UviB family holin-like peptide [Enterococcus faecium]